MFVYVLIIIKHQRSDDKAFDYDRGKNEGDQIMENNMLYQSELPVRYDVDVFIAGGGPAGVAAAVVAARQGASVFLAESFGAFGGAAVTMLVPGFMQFGNGVDFLASGIGKEIHDYIKANASENYVKHFPGSIPVETLKLCYDDMMTSSGAKFAFYTNVIDAVVQDGYIQYVVCAAKGLNYAVHAKIFIDATGDGDLAAMAGAKYEYGDENSKVMASTLCGIWAGIDWSAVKCADNSMLERAFKDHVFTNEDLHLPGMWRLADGIGGSNAGHVYNINGTSADSLTEGIMKGRKQLLEYRRYYREYIPGYENTEMVYSASYIGIRETRRIICDYRLILDDFQRRAVFEDEIGRYCYSVDIHSSTNDRAAYANFEHEISLYTYKKGESYGIPYRSLAVRGIGNLLTAGRCLSTDRYMQSSVRVMPGCFITGQAAGAAAAVCSEQHTDVHNADVHEIQKRLCKLGAFLPNYKD